MYAAYGVKQTGETIAVVLRGQSRKLAIGQGVDRSICSRDAAVLFSPALEVDRIRRRRHSADKARSRRLNNGKLSCLSSRLTT
jgi:hypothetical protein